VRFANPFLGELAQLQPKLAQLQSERSAASFGSISRWRETR
jgi:hypothetical protein